MNDFVPAGYLTHIEAFRQFVRQVRDASFLDLVNPFSHSDKDEFDRAIEWSGNWNQQWEAYAGEFVGYLIDGELDFLAAHPQTREPVRILPDDWKGEFWPQRPFMSDTIQCAGDSKLIKFTDRTPFVEKTAFDSWVRSKMQPKNSTQSTAIAVGSKVSNDLASNFAKQRRWGILPTLVWIATRDIVLAADASLNGKSFQGEDIGLITHKSVAAQENRILNWPLDNLEAAWLELGEAMAGRKLTGLASRISRTRLSSQVSHSPGVTIPPENANGTFIEHSVIEENGQVIVRPKDWAFAHAWIEFSDISFERFSIETFWPENWMPSKDPQKSVEEIKLLSHWSLPMVAVWDIVGNTTESIEALYEIVAKTSNSYFADFSDLSGLPPINGRVAFNNLRDNLLKDPHYGVDAVGTKSNGVIAAIPHTAWGTAELEYQLLGDKAVDRIRITLEDSDGNARSELLSKVEVRRLDVLRVLPIRAPKTLEAIAAATTNDSSTLLQTILRSRDLSPAQMLMLVENHNAPDERILLGFTKQNIMYPQYNDNAHRRLYEAFSTLKGWFLDGKLSATRLDESKNRIPITRQEWNDLTLPRDMEVSSALCHAPSEERFGNQDERALWHGILAERDDVLKLVKGLEESDANAKDENPKQPSSGATPTVLPSQKIDVNTRPISEKELAELFETYKSQGGSLARDAIIGAGRAHFGSRVSITRLKVLYKKVAPHGGHKRGRKPKPANSAK